MAFWTNLILVFGGGALANWCYQKGKEARKKHDNSAYFYLTICAAVVVFVLGMLAKTKLGI